MLEPLAIKEAVGGEIHWGSIEHGATAQIPAPPFYNPGDDLEVYVEDVLVATLNPIGEPENDKFEVVVPRRKLLDYLGSRKPAVFSYVTYSQGSGNANPSQSVEYFIKH